MISSIQWQFYWCSWWRLWPSYTSYAETDDCDTWYTNYFSFGPLQLRWYSNSKGIL